MQMSPRFSLSRSGVSPLVPQSLLLAALAIPACLLTGCNQAPPSDPPKAAKAAELADQPGGQVAETHEHDHSGWWCNEHGVPEEVCGQCSSKLAAEFQKKKDWCKDHDRPDSQCFVCHPELQAKFAAQYEAKYGKAPPKMN